MLKSIGITFGSKALVAVINFIIIVYLSRVLGVAGKGQCSLYLVIFSTAFILCECISGSTVVFLLSTFNYKQLLLVFYSWSIPCCCIIGLAFYKLGKINAAELGLIVGLCWLNAANAIQQLVALGKQKMGLYNRLNVLQAVLSLVFIFAMLGYGVQTPLYYLFALSMAWAISFFIGVFFVFTIKDNTPFVAWKTIVRKGFGKGIPNQFGTFLQLINTRIGYLLLPMAEVGVFSNAISLAEAALLINSSIGTVQYAQVVGHPNRQAQLRLSHHAFWLNAGLMLAALAVLVCLPPSFFSWLFGAGFVGVSVPLPILAAGILLFSFYVIIAYFFSGTGRFGTNNYPAAAALLATLLAYGFVVGMHIAITVSVVAFIMLFSYATLFVVALILLFASEKLNWKYWFTLPPWKDIKKTFV